MLLPKIEFSSAPKTKAGAVVLGWFQEEAPAETAAQKTKPRQPVFVGKSNKDIESLLAQLRESKHFSGKKGEVSILRFFPFGVFLMWFFLVWVPRRNGTARWRDKREALCYWRKGANGFRILTVQADSIFGKVSKSELSYFIQAFCEGYLLAGYEYRDLKKEEKDLSVQKILKLTGPRMEFRQNGSGERSRF